MSDFLLEAEDHWITSFLGLCKSSKFVIEDGDILLVNCPLLLLENINIKDALGEAVLESLQSFHKRYGCGIISFFYMWILWSKGVRHLLKQGFEFSVIMETFNECLDFLINSLGEQEIPLQFVIPSLYRHKSNENIHLEAAKTDYLFATKSKIAKCYWKGCKSSVEKDRYSYQNNQNSMQKNCLLYSYRLYEDDGITESSNTSVCFKDQNQTAETTSHLNTTSSLGDAVLEKEVSAFLGKISHGSDFLVSLVKDVWQKQLKNSSPFLNSFNKDKVVTYVVPGYKFADSIVVDGIVSRYLSPALQDCLFKDNSLLCRSLLIGGDLTPSYVHLGFTPDVSIEKITSCISQNEEEMWVNTRVGILHKLKVSALIIQGTVNKRLLSALLGSIIVVSQVPHSSLCKLAASTGSNIVSYLENCDEGHICKLMIQPLHLRRAMKDDEAFLVINVPDRCICQSVLICHELPYVAHQLEHTFCHYISRLSNICTVKKLLPGKAQTEKFCIRKVQEFSEEAYDESTGLKAEVLHVLSDGLQCYVNKIEEFQAETSCKDYFTDEVTKNTVYDDPLSKTEGWKAALKLALLLSQVDSVIINGSLDSSKSDIGFHHKVTL